MKRFFLLGLLLLYSAVAAAAAPVEQIEQFSSSAVVKEDSSVLVTETIVVRSNEDKIRRGIFRELPYKGVSDYKIVSVSRDGKAEPYSVQKSSSEKTIYIGDSDKLLPAGRYIYTLSYIVQGAVRFQTEFDELYWNVTGNAWKFPIQSASFRLSLPQGAAFRSIRAFPAQKAKTQGSWGTSFLKRPVPWKQGKDLPFPWRGIKEL